MRPETNGPYTAAEKWQTAAIILFFVVLVGIGHFTGILHGFDTCPFWTCGP